jgi:FtsH-binding integral membrane protein
MASYLPGLGSGEEGKYGGGGGDVEAALFPGIDSTEQILRLGFIRKTFSIVSCQLALTALVAGVLMINPATQLYLASSWWIQVLLFLASMLGLIPLYMYKDQHPTNLFLLAGWVS